MFEELSPVDPAQWQFDYLSAEKQEIPTSKFA
jgi:hypothetical protein